MAFIPGCVGAWLEDARRDDLVEAAGMADLGGIAPVDQEGGVAGRLVVADREGADRQVGGAAGWVPGFSDRGAQRITSIQVKAAGGVLVGGGLAGVDAVEVGASAQAQYGLCGGQIRREESVRRAVLKDSRGRQVGDGLGVRRVAGAVRSQGQGARGFQTCHPVEFRIGLELQPDGRQRDRLRRDPRRCRQQRCPSHSTVRGIVGRGLDTPAKTVLLQLPTYL